MKNLVEHSKRIIRRAMRAGIRPAVLSSFGKDSMVLLDLVRETVKRDTFSVHGFPLPVLYFRDPWFPHKHAHADAIARSWAIELHNYLPTAAGVKADNSKRLELVSRYSLGIGYLDLPRNVLGPEDLPRRDYLCGLRDWILRPKSGALTFPFDVLFHGHKSTDVDDFEGHVPLRSEHEQINPKLQIFFPLKDWSDQDVWSYIERHGIAVQEERYHAAGGPESDEAHWHSNDYTHACTACIDPRRTGKVFCPKLQAQIESVGSKVMRLDGLPEYIVRPKQPQEAK